MMEKSILKKLYEERTNLLLLLILIFIIISYARVETVITSGMVRTDATYSEVTIDANDYKPIPVKIVR
jgi:hypothetical protein